MPAPATTGRPSFGGRKSVANSQASTDGKIREWESKLQPLKVLAQQTSKSDVYQARRFLNQLQKAGQDSSSLALETLLKAANSAVMLLPEALKALSGEQVKAARRSASSLQVLWSVGPKNSSTYANSNQGSGIVSVIMIHHVCLISDVNPGPGTWDHLQSYNTPRGF